MAAYERELAKALEALEGSFKQWRKREISAFEEEMPAILARKLGTSLITKTMARRYQIDMKSYDRIFPNQDTMPKGGYGNLIALPFQKEAMRRGNSSIRRAFAQVSSRQA